MRGALPGHVAGLRADMDALPITEDSGEACASQIAGKMHACGHDSHTAMLLGAARVLQESRDTFAGTAVLLFQPAEEGPGGAQPMIDEGALDDPRVEAVTMLHVDPRLATGTIGITPGPVNAAADEFHLTIRGKGGHGAYPHKAVDVDPVRGRDDSRAAKHRRARDRSARVDRRDDRHDRRRLSQQRDRRSRVHDRHAAHARSRDAREPPRRSCAASSTASPRRTARARELEMIFGYPPVVNDGELAEAFAAYTRAHGFTVERPPPTMGGEDFAYFAQRVPGVMVRLGIYNEAVGQRSLRPQPAVPARRGRDPDGHRDARRLRARRRRRFGAPSPALRRQPELSKAFPPHPQARPQRVV